jgi:DNA-binding transcriptional LysR family regulator
LARDGYDAVVRIGELDDSSLVARRIGEQSILACASPEYLRGRGVPRSPAELESHDCLVYRLPSTGRPRQLQFRDGRRRMDVSPELRVVLDDGEALVAAACAGLGIIQVPDYMVEDALRSGRLREVLAKHRPPPTRISLVYPSARQATPRLRALIEVLTRRTREAA